MCLLHYRTPCTQAVGLSTDTQSLQEQAPIQVASKPKCCKHLQNVFLDDRGFPDQSDDYDTLLHGVDGSPILWKLKHPQPDLKAPIDPCTFCLSLPQSMRPRCIRTWICLIWTHPSRLRFIRLSKITGLCSTRRVCLSQSRIMNASSTLDPHGPSQSKYPIWQAGS